MDSFILAKDLTFKYNNENEKNALNGVNLTIEKGEFAAVLGHNGSGKSTFAKHMNALLIPTSGEMKIDGKLTSMPENIWAIRQSCGMVFQNPDNQIIATIVEEDVAFGLENLGVPSQEIINRVHAALFTVDMDAHHKAMSGYLSGGQKQRIAIAGVLAMKPRCIVFDEPTAMLDPLGRKGVLQAIDHLVEQGVTVILITHFMEEAIRANRVIVMDEGKVVMDASPRVVFGQVEKLKTLALDIPQITELSYNLSKIAPINPDILTIDEMTTALKQSVKPHNKAIFSREQPPEKKEPILSIKNLTYVYSPQTAFEKLALKDINLDIEKGCFTGIIGHTGSGKSTFIQHLNGLLKPTSGTIFLEGEDIHSDKTKMKALRQKVGLIFQYPEHQLFEMTVFKDVAFGPVNMELNEDEVKKRVEKALELVSIPKSLHQKSPFELSGGQKRRVAIAGILAMEPEILILDEPTAGLDPRGREDILNQIYLLHKEMQNTIILVSHSMEDIARFAKELVVLDKGEIKYRGSPREIFTKADELEKIGLAAPKISYLVKALAKENIYLKEDIFTVEEAFNEIKRLL